MRRVLLAAAVAAPLALAVGLGSTAPSGAAAARVYGVRDVSANWSGFAATSADSTFTDVTATWQIPTATCDSSDAASAAMWVGLGGFNVGAQSLEQTGTASDCNNGKPTYYIWYELVPQPSVNVKFKVNPGDTITASVVVDGTTVLVQDKDRTRKTSFTKRIQMADPDLSSAEWITEAPSECGSANFCRVVPLANFGTVNFSHVAALANGTGGTLTTNAGWTIDSIQLVPQTHRFFGDPLTGAGSTGAGAKPSSPSSDGTGFSVTWSAAGSSG